MITAIPVTLAILVVGTIVLCWPRVTRYVNEVAACGSVRPISKGAQRRAQWAARILAFVQVGRIRVRGLEHLAQSGPTIIAPNHPHYADAVVVPLVVDTPARYFAARGVFTAFRGLGALFLGSTGVVSVDLRPGRGTPALRSAIRLLVSGERLVIFPEGWAHMDGVPGPLKRGVAYIAREASAELGQAVTIIPVFLRYGRYPGARIKRFAPRIQYLFVFAAFWYYRRGVTVVVGEPFSATTMPHDPSEATRMLEHRIRSLDPALAA